MSRSPYRRTGCLGCRGLVGPTRCPGPAAECRNKRPPSSGAGLAHLDMDERPLVERFPCLFPGLLADDDGQLVLFEGAQ